MRLLLLIFATFFTLSLAVTPEQIEKIKALHQQCFTPQFPKEEYEKIRNGKAPLDNPEMKKHILCIYKKIDYIDETGNIKENILKKRLLTSVSEDEANKVIGKCAVKKNTDEETAFSLFKCLGESQVHFSPVD